VYKAKHKESGTYFAIKILDLEHDDDAQLIENEINILKACKHNNIVQYYGVCSKDNKIWVSISLIVLTLKVLMDWCELGSMRRVMEVLNGSFVYESLGNN
jgi:serine/threonine protein kinase